MVRLAQDALFLQPIGTSPHGFDGQTKKTGEGGTGNALLDLVRFNGFDTAKSAIKFGVLHDVEHVRVHDCMNDEQIQGMSRRASGPTQYGYGDGLIASIATCSRCYFLR